MIKIFKELFKFAYALFFFKYDLQIVWRELGGNYVSNTTAETGHRMHCFPPLKYNDVQWQKQQLQKWSSAPKSNLSTDVTFVLSGTAQWLPSSLLPICGHQHFHSRWWYQRFITDFVRGGCGIGSILKLCGESFCISVLSLGRIPEKSPKYHLPWSFPGA